MKTTQLLAFVVFFSMVATLPVDAQSTKLVRPAALNTPAVKHTCPEILPTAPSVVQVQPAPVRPPSSSPVAFRANREVLIGFTTYDIQTNNGICNRVSVGPDGRIMGTWIKGDEPASYPDRGTGYNTNPDGVWGDPPADRIEAATRTGWPNHVVTASGGEFVVAHTGANDLHISRKAAGSSAWEESDIPTQTPSGLLWPRAAGSGETVHVLAITTPIDFGASGPYNGVDGHPLYFRSPDGGATWDVVDFAIPGLDSTALAFVGPDVYTINARGETVVVGLFHGFSDIMIFKSTDNGDTWTQFILKDFPIDKYVEDSGYSFEDLPPYDPDQPDSLAILSTDGAGAVAIDHDGMVHAFWGRMYVLDTPGDGATNYYPGVSGLMYWNESFGPDSSRQITDVVDLNGNDTIDIETGDQISGYNVGLTSFPTAGVDADGNLYLTYLGIMESMDFFNEEDQQFYRHVYVMASQDGGETWTEPYDIINADIVAEPDLVNFVESAFPAMAPDVGETINIVYQADFRPGTAVGQDADEPVENFINFVALPREDLVSKAEEAVQPEFFQMAVQPNPANNEALVSFELDNNAQYSLSMLDIMGRKVADIETANGFANNQVRVNVSNLTPGVYLLRLQAENKVAVAKLMVQ